MNSENLINDVESILDDLYPKNSYEGDFITVPNTIKGLKSQIVCEEDTDVTVCNKNLANFSYSASWNGTSVSINGNTITLNKSSTGAIAAPSIAVAKAIKIKAGTTLTSVIEYVSGTRIVDDDSNYYWQFGINFVRADGTYERLVESYRYTEDDIESARTSTLTLSEDIEGIQFYCYIPTASPKTDGNIIFKLQLEIGDTSTDFVEHEEVVCSGTEINFKTFDEVTNIYNESEVNMVANVRRKDG